MDCPYCGRELVYQDYFGRLCSHQDGKVLGDIYKCPWEDDENCTECDSSAFNSYFHVYRDIGNLEEGYPC